MISYTSHTAILEGTSKIFTPRVAGYSVVLVVMISLLSFFVLTRSDIETTIVRVQGQLYQRTDDGMISNLYNIQFVNKTFEPVTLELRLKGVPNGSIEKIGGGPIEVAGGEMSEGVFMVKIPQEEIIKPSTTLEFDLYNGDQAIEKVSTKFLGPISLRNN